MNRSDEPLFDTRIADWFEDDPHSAPDQALDIVLAAFPSIKQRRALRVPWRYSNVSSPLRLAVVAAAMVVAVVGGASLLGPQGAAPEVGGQPTPSVEPSVGPSPSPAATTSVLDTSAWTTYTSSRYGFTIAHPADWSEVPADHDWSFESEPQAWDSSGTESFTAEGTAEGQGVRVSAWSATVDPGTTVEQWIEAYCMAQDYTAACPGILDRLVNVQTGDQRPGLAQYGSNLDTIAYFLDGQTVYVVAIWRAEFDPALQRFGGARRLLEAFVSTMIFPAEPAQESPAS